MANPDAPRWPSTKFTRRAFLGGLGAAIALPILAACTPRPSPETPTPTSVSRRPGPSKPTAETPKPAPVEGLKTVENQVKAVALDTLFYAISSSQQYQDTYYGDPRQTILTSAIINPISSFPKTEIILGKPIPPDSDLLKIKWAYGQKTRLYTGRIFGEGEIKNIKIEIESASQVTDADKANGIQWKGSVDINYINRYRLLLPINPPNTEEGWAKVTIPQPTIPFTKWQDESINGSFVLKNGRWEKEESIILYPIRFPIKQGMNHEYVCNAPDCESVNVGSGREVPIEPAQHVPEGAPIEYKNTPPSSGPHYPSPRPWGMYLKEVPEGGWVHNLEHSGVVILYKCDQPCPDLEKQLADLYQTFPPSEFGNVKLLVTPYSKLKNKITAVSWGLIDEMDSFDRDRLLQFYRAGIDKGPEHVP